MKHIFILLLSMCAFAQNNTKQAAIQNLLINGKGCDNCALKVNLAQLKDAEISLGNPAELPAGARIASYELTFPEKQNIVCAGNKLNMFAQHKFSELSPGDTFTIQNIKYTLPKDKTYYKCNGKLKVILVK